ncbi:MAG: winged helix-turn-helix transcriptional regulator [Denitromonas halophila]|nr:MAG: winged helix-turn-helix transcriptional regulator [Denitromonas halophila]TVT75704.1 MAG: winged helix-turn-helix transcriptional regulator [Denitromonas halophila]
MEKLRCQRSGRRPTQRRSHKHRCRTPPTSRFGKRIVRQGIIVQPNATDPPKLMPRKSPDAPPDRANTLDLLGFFYPIHYRIGMELERRMCQGQLSRQQAAIIWLIESEVGAHGWMRRKEIERLLSDWFESRNSHVTHLLRELAEPPLALVTQRTNPDCAREKLVALTDNGRAHFDTMIKAGLDYFAELFPHLGNKELQDGIRFLGRAFGTPSLGKRS